MFSCCCCACPGVRSRPRKRYPGVESGVKSTPKLVPSRCKIDGRKREPGNKVPPGLVSSILSHDSTWRSKLRVPWMVGFVDSLFVSLHLMRFTPWTKPSSLFPRISLLFTHDCYVSYSILRDDRDMCLLISLWVMLWFRCQYRHAAGSSYEVLCGSRSSSLTSRSDSSPVVFLKLYTPRGTGAI